jgi:hypothetical protein
MDRPIPISFGLVSKTAKDSGAPRRFGRSACSHHAIAAVAYHSSFITSWSWGPWFNMHNCGLG